MSNSSASGDKGKEGLHIWEGSFGRHRFRAQWVLGAGHTELRFQGPFIEDDDPDGMGVPFSSDFVLEWENRRRVSINGEYVYPHSYEPGRHRPNTDVSLAVSVSFPEHWGKIADTPEVG